MNETWAAGPLYPSGAKALGHGWYAEAAAGGAGSLDVLSLLRRSHWLRVDLPRRVTGHGFLAAPAEAA